MWIDSYGDKITVMTDEDLSMVTPSPYGYLHIHVMPATPSPADVGHEQVTPAIAPIENQTDGPSIPLIARSGSSTSAFVKTFFEDIEDNDIQLFKLNPLS
eukprot:TRINITY_DN104_c0_g1::TRINITY_DN104_c0_g1_i1::g.14434::m.14434 TRINITY_DN104_c0_g1::TRINITY_DN104_c0_g1_i1::g.14434  ORF type:complete len:100 (-),score=12.38 TRINITY_DN104_c0_g1_i1:565-864(-)